MLPQEILIFIILLPLFLVIFLVALGIKKFNKAAQKHPHYWLGLMSISAIIYVYGYTTDSLSRFSLAATPIILLGSYVTYQKLLKSRVK